MVIEQGVILLDYSLCIDIDECYSQPCLNGGNCNNLPDAFSCTCSPRWSGTHCETGNLASQSIPQKVTTRPTLAVTDLEGA